MTIGDFNRDGKPDVSAVTDYGVSVLLGRGDGTLNSHSDYPIRGAYSVVTGDLNVDGNPDIVVTNGLTNTLALLLGRGDGSFEAESIKGAGSGPVAVGDLNRDGKLDLALGDGSHAVSIVLGNGDGTFQAPAEFAVDPDPWGPRSVVIGDFNGDGKPDLAVSNSIWREPSPLAASWC